MPLYLKQKCVKLEQKSRMSGTSSAIRIRNIRKVRAPIEQSYHSWFLEGDWTGQAYAKNSLVGMRKTLVFYLTRSEHRMEKSHIGSCMSTVSRQMKMEHPSPSFVASPSKAGGGSLQVNPASVTPHSDESGKSKSPSLNLTSLRCLWLCFWYFSFCLAMHFLTCSLIS